ncbi:MAG: hypothetical protein FJ137_08915 [Deltaproteobacteria bacterium]|nr:hypothetical protein [Deltaproteobacteria bacterium]
MKTIFPASPPFPGRSVVSANDRPPAATATPAAEPAVVDHFVRAAPQAGEIMASTLVGVVSAFLLNGAAMVSGASGSMTGLGPTPPPRHPIAPSTELVVRRGLGGA